LGGQVFEPVDLLAGDPDGLVALGQRREAALLEGEELVQQVPHCARVVRLTVQNGDLPLVQLQARDMSTVAFLQPTRLTLPFGVCHRGGNRTSISGEDVIAFTPSPHIWFLSRNIGGTSSPTPC
jgi:hypothetical protein